MMTDKVALPRRSMAIILATALAIGMFWLVSVRAYIDLRDTRFVEASADAQKALAAFEEHANRVFDYGDTHLRSIRSFYLAYGLGDGLRRHVADIRTPDDDRVASEMFITDRAGRMVFHSIPAGVGRDISGIDYFSAIRAAPGDDLYIDPTRVGIVTGKYGFRILRKIIRNGEFDGVIGMVLPPQHMADFYKVLDLGPNSSLLMVKEDHRYIVRQPLPSDAIYGRTMDSPSLWDSLRDRPRGIYSSVSVVDGEHRMFGYKKLDNYPVVIDVGVAERDIMENLKPARRNMVIQGVIFTVVAVLFCWLVLLILSQNRSLTAKSRQLALSNADLERFAYAASHDLQTPLRTIGSYAQLLHRRYRDRLDADADEFLGYMVEAARHLSSLITDMLDYARAGSPGRPQAPVAAERAFERAVANLRAAIDETGAVVTAGELPVLLGDETQVVSLFQNLIENALKYRHPERVPEIKVSAWPMSSLSWCFAVEDNGIGIEESYFDKIFVIFQRLQPGGSEGTGVGLALCQRIVRRLGGDIWVESTLGQGTTFYFTAPRQE